MEHIYVKLFNIPSATVNGQGISFPFRKAEAMFYYLVVNKEAARDELSDMLWPEVQNDIGRKNIRNAIYKIKKCLGCDVLISPQKSTIILNPKINITSDLDILLGDDKWFEAYTGDFLQGFIIKDEETFEEWVINSRERYKNLYIQKLYKKLKSDFANKDYAAVECEARQLKEIDQYDEKAHRILMRVYAETGLFNKAIDVYNRLLEVLKNDLGVIPDAKSRSLYQKIIEIRNHPKHHTSTEGKDFFYGRTHELGKLNKHYKDFKNGVVCNSLLIIGEAGIGKTKLKDKFIDEVDKSEVFILESNCYQAEEEFPFKPWEGIFSSICNIIQETQIEIPPIWRNVLAIFTPRFGIPDENTGFNTIANIDGLKFKFIEEVVVSLFKKIAKLKKVVIVLDDIQWMDNLSISLLTSILLHINKDVLVIAACRNGFLKKIDDFISEMIKYNRLYKIELERFTKEEVRDFIDTALSGSKLTGQMYENIYTETEGNTFFMIEYLNLIKENKDVNMMSSRMSEILKCRFIGISDEGQKVLNIISIFFDEVPIDILIEISGLDELELLDILDDLKMRFIIKELKDKIKPGIMFTHQKLRDYIYGQLLESRKQILHDRTGRIFERRLQNNDKDISLYSRLIYHFLNGGNLICALKYSIKNANFYLDINHELFPVLYTNYENSNNYPYLSGEDTYKYLNDIEELLDKVKQTYAMNDDVIKLEIACLHMKGRYLIREGEYKKGVELIKHMIDSSLQIGDIDYALKGCRQMIYYGIQVREVKVMKEYIDMGLKMAKEQGWNADMGMFLRHKGLYKIMNREYDEAENLLKECISKFKSVKEFTEKYSIHIAAAYSYIGDIRRYSMRFQSSLKYYDKAISICENRNVLPSLTIFCTNAGQSAFDMGDYISAKVYFKRALEVYKQLDSIWGRGIAEGYMSLILIMEENFKEALSCLKSADVCSNRIKNPYEIGIIYRIKSEIRSKMESNIKLNEVFSEYLYLDILSYCEKGLKLLQEVNDTYQADILEVFVKQNRSTQQGHK